MPGLRERSPDLLLAAVVAALDQWTKSLVVQALPPYHERPIVEGLLSLRHGRNPGLAFGLLSRGSSPWQGWGLSLLTAGALALLIVYLLRLPERPRLPRFALALILGGAVGNLVDRLRLGYVTDFIHVFHGAWQWHDFNAADAAISVGVALLILGSLSRPRGQD